jgi:pimeloyl-ACP methyl ester carboxylesterase
MFRKLALGLFLLACLAFAGLWVAGSVLIHPAREIVGAPPSEFPASTVVFKSSSDALIHGWFLRGNGRGAILLLHGVRANRLAMLNRARFLHAFGYSVLLIDFQASGESTGDAITFGHLESRDAAAAVDQLKKLAPGEKIGVLGTSMGGAATLLADPPLNVDAIILEQVYPTLSQAIEDRLQIHMGIFGSWFAPLLMSTVKPHLGFSLDEMRPIDKIGKIHAPKLLIVGDADRDTKIGESLAMFDAASASKELWIVHGARHVDFYRYSGSTYQIRVLGFFNKWLRGPSLQ